MKAIFIDRDGVLNDDPGGWTRYNYVTDWEEFRFLPGAFEALRILKENDTKVVIISNQAGVSKGYFSKEKLDEINAKMSEEIEKKGGAIEQSYYCLHRDEDNCDCRKPRVGLFEMAREKYGVDFKGTYFIGDSKADIMAGKAIGCKTILVLSGKASLEEVGGWGDKPDYIFKNLLESVKWLVRGGRL